MTKIKDIADKLGISASTVSKGLNGAHDISPETRKLVLDTAIEMGYVTKKIRARRRKKICILIEHMDYITPDSFGYDIILGFKKSASERDYDVDVIETTVEMQESERYDLYIYKKSYDGVFMLGLNLDDIWTKQLSTSVTPTVLFDNFIEDNSHVGYVGSDSFEGIQKAVNYLADLGHKKIAFLNGGKNARISLERHQAFEASLKQAGLLPDPNLIHFGEYNIDCTEEVLPKFIDNGATAIMCASDIIASRVLNTLNKMSIKIPEDISVIGYDDIPIASKLTPSLTTIHQDRGDLGQSAFLLLDGLIHNVAISKMLLRTSFVERESTSSVKKS